MNKTQTISLLLIILATGIAYVVLDRVETLVHMPMEAPQTIVECRENTNNAEVALWYIDSTNDLMSAEGLEAIQAVLDKQNEYARHLVLREALQ